MKSSMPVIEPGDARFCSIVIVKLENTVRNEKLADI
jgi:hypothetical protein